MPPLLSGCDCRDSRFCDKSGIVHFLDFLLQFSDFLFQASDAALHLLNERVAALGIGGQKAHVVLKGLQLAHALLVGAHQTVAFTQAAFAAR